VNAIVTGKVRDSNLITIADRSFNEPRIFKMLAVASHTTISFEGGV
jgi:hypothetical protein